MFLPLLCVELITRVKDSNALLLGFISLLLRSMIIAGAALLHDWLGNRSIERLVMQSCLQSCRQNNTNGRLCSNITIDYLH